VIGLQGRIANHLERHRFGAVVVSVKEKAQDKCVRYESGRRTSVNHRSSVETTRWHQNQGRDVDLGRSSSGACLLGERCPA
jgi:hypothetical protein